MTHLKLFNAAGIWLEDFQWTPIWVHMQVVPPGSGNRIFVPNKSKPPARDNWSGDYPEIYDNKNFQYVP